MAEIFGIDNDYRKLVRDIEGINEPVQLTKEQQMIHLPSNTAGTTPDRLENPGLDPAAVAELPPNDELQPSPQKRVYTGAGGMQDDSDLARYRAWKAEQDRLGAKWPDTPQPQDREQVVRDYVEKKPERKGLGSQVSDALSGVNLTLPTGADRNLLAKALIGGGDIVGGKDPLADMRAVDFNDPNSPTSKEYQRIASSALGGRDMSGYSAAALQRGMGWLFEGMPPGKKGMPDIGESTEARERAKQRVKLAEAVAEIKSTVPTFIADIDRALGHNEKSMSGLKYKAAETSMRNLGGVGVNKELFENTRKATTIMKNMVAKVLKSTFGGQLSEGEREYLNSVYGAMESYSPKEREVAMKEIQRIMKSKLEDTKKKEYFFKNPGAKAAPIKKTKEDPLGLGL